MCGRYALYALPVELLVAVLGYDPVDEHGLRLPRWNVPPTSRMPVFRAGRDGRRTLDVLRWGLVPSWAPDLKIGASCINARAETVATKNSFRAAFAARRCLVPASAFYEWEKDVKPKRPHRFQQPGGAPFLMAGLWESWTSRDTAEVVETFTIVTTEASAEVRPVHDRMPVILPPEHWSAWLDPSNRDTQGLGQLLRPFDALERQAVAPTINDARHDERPVEVELGSAS